MTHEEKTVFIAWNYLDMQNSRSVQMGSEEDGDRIVKEKFRTSKEICFIWILDLSEYSFYSGVMADCIVYTSGSDSLVIEL